MRTGISFTVAALDRRRLKEIVSARASPQKHVWRARIIFLSAEGLGTHAIMAETGKSKTCAWRWLEQFMEEGVEWLLRDKTRPPDKVAGLVRMTLEPAPHEATHWTSHAMADAMGLYAIDVAEDLESAPSCAARRAISSPMPRLAPVMNRVFPLRVVMSGLPKNSFHRTLSERRCNVRNAF